MEAIAERKKLQSDYELAKGIQYTEPMPSTWRAPAYLRQQSEEEKAATRKKYHVLVVISLHSNIVFVFAYPHPFIQLFIQNMFRYNNL